MRARDQAGKVENFEDLGRCPCGKRIGASRQSFAVVHEVPQCKIFMELEPIEYMRYVRSARGISDS